MATHTITPAVVVVCRCKAKAILTHLPQGHHTTVITAQNESRFVAEDDLIPIHCNSTSSCMTHSKVGVISSTRNGYRNNRCPLARSLAMVRENTGSRSEGVSCVWTADSTNACR
ncbi:hypothetical protein TNCV_2347821 [Trichonephila clavipes]|nr:hypothetical protein TNCV_2347821 [Trichonephila clavipes]